MPRRSVTERELEVEARLVFLETLAKSFSRQEDVNIVSAKLDRLTLYLRAGVTLGAACLLHVSGGSFADALSGIAGLLLGTHG